VISQTKWPGLTSPSNALEICQWAHHTVTLNGQKFTLPKSFNFVFLHLHKCDILPHTKIGGCHICTAGNLGGKVTKSYIPLLICVAVINMSNTPQMEVNRLHIFFLLFRAIRIEYYMNFDNIKVTPFNTKITEITMKALWSLCYKNNTFSHSMQSCSVSFAGHETNSWSAWKFLMSVCYTVHHLRVVLALPSPFTTEECAVSKILCFKKQKTMDNAHNKLCCALLCYTSKHVKFSFVTILYCLWRFTQTV